MSALTTIQIPTDYGYALLTAASSYVLSIWLGLRTGPYRRAAKVAHPSVSASAETIAHAKSEDEKRALYLFNCAQRAHHNVLENYPSVLTGMLISGIEYPRLAAALGAVWVLGRVGYALGYTSTRKENVDGKGRFYHGGFHAATLSQCDKTGRGNENDPCSECHWFGGADGKCVAAPHSTYNDQAWAQMLNRSVGLDTVVKYTLPPQKNRLEGKVRWRSRKSKPVDVGPMTHVKPDWQGESRDSLLSKPDFIPAAVRANTRAYLVPPSSELQDTTAHKEREWKDAHPEERSDLKRA